MAGPRSCRYPAWRWPVGPKEAHMRLLAASAVALAILGTPNLALAQRGQGRGQSGPPPQTPAAAKPDHPSTPPQAQGANKGADKGNRPDSPGNGAAAAIERNPRLADSMRELLP